MFRIISRSLILIFISFLILIAAIILDCKDSQKSYDKFIPYIEDIFSDESNKTTIKNLNLEWNSKKNTIQISIKDLVRTNREHNKTLISCPEVFIDFSLSSFLPGNNSLNKIILNQAEINPIIGDNKKHLLLGLFHFMIQVNHSILHLKSETWEANGEFILSTHKLVVSKLELLRENPSLGKKSFVKMSGYIKNKIINLSLETNNFAIDDIYYFWPHDDKLSDWIKTSVSNGRISDAKAQLYINSDDAAFNKLSGYMTIENVDLKYHEKLPIIKKIDAKLIFGDENIDVLVSKAYTGKSIISDTNVKISYLKKTLDISGKAIGEIADLISFMPDEKILTAKKNNIDLFSAKGTANTKIKKITIDFKENINPEEIIYDIESDLSNCQIPGLPDKIILKNGTLKLNLDSKEAKLEGRAILNDLESQISWHGYNDIDSQYDFTLKISTEIPAKYLNLKLFNENAFKEGYLANNVMIYNKNGRNNVKFKGDLTNADISITTIGFNKPKNKKSYFTADADISNDTIKISNISLSGDDFTIKGNANYSRKMASFNQIKLDTIKFSKNDFNLEYLLNKDGYKTNISGAMINLSDAQFDQIFDSSGKNQNKNISINISAMLMKSDILYSHVNGYIKCSESFGCNDAALNAKMNKNYNLGVKMTPSSKDNSIIAIKSDNASLFVKSFGIYREINGGNLSIDATKSGTKIDGHLNIKDFSATKTSFFSKLITLTSLPGLIGLLSSDLIPFNSMNVDFDIKDKEMLLRNGKIDGGQMALSIAGKIDLKQNTVNLEGVLVPDLFLLNRALSSIPLIGNILKGSNKDSIISINYTVNGPFNNSKIQVNPLTMTPGIIKSIFGIFGPNTNQK